MPSLLAVYDKPGSVAAVARRLQNRGYGDIEVYSPAAFPELDDVVDSKPSRVRTWTLVGGLLGAVTGYALTIWMANDWQLMLGGKPFSSIPPYTVIAFELTILFGGLMTLLGLLVVGKLPSGSFGKHAKAYSARFSGEEFGLVVGCKERDVLELDALLRDYDAKEVTLVEP
jgi:molybdopterin-containing oxidoreductase family membrane subunit